MPLVKKILAFFNAMNLHPFGRYKPNVEKLASCWLSFGVVAGVKQCDAYYARIADILGHFNWWSIEAIPRHHILS